MSSSPSPEPGQILLSSPYPEPINAPTHDDVILYHQVWRALRKGSPTQAALPPEIVLYIVKFAGWMLPNRARTVKATDTVFIRCLVTWGEDRETAKVSKRWFASEPFTAVHVENVAAFQLVTVSRDQGWTSLNPPASFSWFEVAMERQGQLVPQLQWKSHHNDLAGQAMTRVEGAIVPARAGWQVGDVVTVWPYAQSALWSNEAKWGELRFYKWFQPVIPLKIGEL